MLVGLVLFGFPSAIIAYYKGFAPLRWILAFGIVGLVVVLCLKTAKSRDKKPISHLEANARADRANTVGAWMCGLNISLGIVSLAIALS